MFTVYRVSHRKIFKCSSAFDFQVAFILTRNIIDITMKMVTVSPRFPFRSFFFLSRLSSFLETQNMLIRTTFCSSTIHSSAILCSVYLISRHGIFGRLKNNISIIISIHEAINSVLRVIEQWFGHGIGCGSYSATASMHMVNVQG